MDDNMIVVSGLLITSVCSSLYSRGLKEQFGFSNVRKIIPGAQAYSKTIPPFTMTFSSAIFLAEVSYSLAIAALLLIIISLYTWSSNLAWRQFLSNDKKSSEEKVKMDKQQFSLTFLANALTFILWVSIIVWLRNSH